MAGNAKISSPSSSRIQTLLPRISRQLFDNEEFVDVSTPALIYQQQLSNFFSLYLCVFFGSLWCEDGDFLSQRERERVVWKWLITWNSFLQANFMMKV